MPLVLMGFHRFVLLPNNISLFTLGLSGLRDIWTYIIIRVRSSNSYDYVSPRGV